MTLTEAVVTRRGVNGRRSEVVALSRREVCRRSVVEKERPVSGWLVSQRRTLWVSNALNGRLERRATVVGWVVWSRATVKMDVIFNDGRRLY